MAGPSSELVMTLPSPSLYEEISVSNPKLAEGLQSVTTIATERMTPVQCSDTAVPSMDFLTLSFLLT